MVGNLLTFLKFISSKILVYLLGFKHVKFKVILLDVGAYVWGKTFVVRKFKKFIEKGANNISLLKFLLGIQVKYGNKKEICKCVYLYDLIHTVNIKSHTASMLITNCVSLEEVSCFVR